MVNVYFPAASPREPEPPFGIRNGLLLCRRSGCLRHCARCAGGHRDQRHLRAGNDSLVHVQDHSHDARLAGLHGGGLASLAAPAKSPGESGTSIRMVGTSWAAARAESAGRHAAARTAMRSPGTGVKLQTCGFKTAVLKVMRKGPGKSGMTTSIRDGLRFAYDPIYTRSSGDGSVRPRRPGENPTAARRSDTPRRRRWRRTPASPCRSAPG